MQAHREQFWHITISATDYCFTTFTISPLPKVYVRHVTIQYGTPGGIEGWHPSTFIPSLEQYFHWRLFSSSNDCSARSTAFQGLLFCTTFPVADHRQQYAFSRQFRQKGFIALNTYLKQYQYELPPRSPPWLFTYDCVVLVTLLISASTVPFRRGKESYLRRAS